MTDPQAPALPTAEHSETQPSQSESEASRHRDRHRTRPARDAGRGLALDVPGPAPAHPPEIPEERLDADAIRTIARLRHVGHQAYFVGGCVRDVLLGHAPKDFDVATSAHPGEVRAVFRNCRLIGRRFRLAHVYFRGGKVIEVATFRKNPIDAAEDLPDDGDLLITRDNVFGTAEEDARRRDFTVNGLFYDVFAGEVIDYVGGRADLEAHRIATIGDPEIRIQEDPVRSLRAIRFAARLGFSIEPETFAAMRRHAPELARCAPPRLLEETFKILRCGASARAFELLRSSASLGVVLPAVGAFYDAAGDEARRRFVAHLTSLDQLVKSGVAPSEAVLLGALLLHLPAGEAGGERDRMLTDLVATARLPRRIAERARLALGSQRTFHGQARRRRRGFSSQAYFDDALQLLEITVRATGEGADELERWRSGRPAHDHHPEHRGVEHHPEHRGVEHAPDRAGRGGRSRGHGRNGTASVEAETAPSGEGPGAASHPGRAAEATAHAAPPAEDRPSDGPRSPEGDKEAPAGRRRRRRRGGRRRRRRGAAAAAPQA